VLFRKASEESEARILTAVGMTLVVCAVAAVTVAFANPFGGRRNDHFGVVIESPYVGQGVDRGTTLVMHGIKVGEVTNVMSLPAGGIRLTADLQSGPTAGLTDTMGIDFRPANYFGVTAINLRPGEGGQALTDGRLIKITPAGNFTLQALLSRLGDLSDKVLAPRVVDMIERATTYLDGLDPLVETLLVVANSLAKVQTVSTARLLRNATGISVAFPGFVNSATNLGDNVVRGPIGSASDEFFNYIYRTTIDLASTDLWGAIGKLETGHSTDLAPFTDMIKVLTDVTPALVPPDAIADTARELRMRLERLFAGPPDRRAVNVRVILDSLPGVAAPIDAVGGLP
jgi:hypothetical protein